MGPDWDNYVRSRFPGYLLPESAAKSLSVEQASRFLEAISGRADQLSLLRAVSLFTPRIAELNQFVAGSLLDLARNLPSRTERIRREWEGGFQGRLSIPETLDLHMAGRRTTFVTQSRLRSFDLAENRFLRATCERLLGVLVSLRIAKAMPDPGWATGARECEGILRRVLSSTTLREVPSTGATIADENAGRAARHVAYRHAVAWAGWMRDALDEADPAKIAKVVADGALAPLADSTRFELAVVLRFGEALSAAFERDDPRGWRMERALVIGGRKDIFAFVRDDGVAVRLFYNQAVLPSGAADLGGAHYLGNTGRMRPDLTVTITSENESGGALVVECKLSEDPGYVLRGYHEAVLYRWEYAEHLIRWPKAVLVASSAVPGTVRLSDDVIATSWTSWPPQAAIDAIVARTREL
jgi:hypothetical protein